MMMMMIDELCFAFVVNVALFISLCHRVLYLGFDDDNELMMMVVVVLVSLFVVFGSFRS